MKKLILLMILFLALQGCKEKLKSYETNEKGHEEDYVIENEEVPFENKSQTVNYGQLDKRLVKIIKEVVAEFPLEKIEASPSNVQQSYYVSFFSSKRDTILAICRQPLLMELFPDFAFEKHETPKEEPEYVGMVKDVDLPIFIFDSDGIGNEFYGKAAISKAFPEKYLPDEGKYHTPEVPPIFKYRIENNNFTFIGKSKKQWIN